MLNKILNFYTKFFAVWIVLFGIIAYNIPGPFIALKPYNTWFFALTMFGIGAVLSIDDFKRIAQKPLIVAIGSIAQFTIMPVGAFMITKAFGVPPEISIGLILAGCAPGAMASNVMSYIAKADIAYSVSLTTVSTLLCPILTPGLTKLFADASMEVEFLQMVKLIILMVILPLLAGFALRHFREDQIKKIELVFPAISVTFIIFICSLVIASNKSSFDYRSDGFFKILIMVTILNVYGMLAGYGTGKLFKMDLKRRRTLSIEIGMQNAGLGTVLAIKYFGTQSAIPTALFVFICIITASIMAEIWHRKPALPLQ